MEAPGRAFTAALSTDVPVKVRAVFGLVCCSGSLAALDCSGYDVNPLSLLSSSKNSNPSKDPLALLWVWQLTTKLLGSYRSSGCLARDIKCSAWASDLSKSLCMPTYLQ